MVFFALRPTLRGLFLGFRTGTLLKSIWFDCCLRASAWSLYARQAGSMRPRFCAGLGPPPVKGLTGTRREEASACHGERFSGSLPGNRGRSAGLRPPAVYQALDLVTGFSTGLRGGTVEALRK